MAEVMRTLLTEGRRSHGGEVMKFQGAEVAAVKRSRLRHSRCGYKAQTAEVRQNSGPLRVPPDRLDVQRDPHADRSDTHIL